MDAWNIKTKIYSGSDSLKILERLSGKAVFIVCDPFLIQTPLFNEIVAGLQHNRNQISIFSEVTPNPPIEDITACIERMKGYDPDILLAVGGGSAIDLAKGAMYFSRVIAGASPQEFIAVPTTSGTGSEVTNISVITDTQKNIKYPIADDSLLPDIAILNPQMVLSCPPSVTAYSGLDVLTHALEALVATGSNAYTDALAEKAVELVFGFLYKAYTYGSNLQYRMKMHEASCLAGLAFNSAGLGICHAIAHQLGGQFHLVHGLANAMLLPRVVRFNSADPKARQKYSALAKKLGMVSGAVSEQEAVAALVQQITYLCLKVKSPLNLQNCQVKKEAAAAAEWSIVTNALNDITARTNPIKVTEEDLLKVYRQII